MAKRDKDDTQFRRIISDPKETPIEQRGGRVAINAETGEPLNGPIGDTILTSEEAKGPKDILVSLEGRKEGRMSDIAFDGVSESDRVSDINFAGSAEQSGNAHMSDLQFDADPESAVTDIALDGGLDSSGINSHLHFREGGVSVGGGNYPLSQSEQEISRLKSEMHGLADEVRNAAMEAAKNAAKIGALGDATKLPEKLAERLGNVKAGTSEIKAETERLNEKRNALK